MRGFYSSVLYKRLPIALQNTFVTAKGFAYTSLRRGSKFAFLQDQLLCNERLNSEELAILQLIKLKSLLGHAYEHVPFYRRQFDELGFNPEELASVDDLRQLPLLEKKTIREHSSEFVASNASKWFLFKGSTSGSTGTPLSLYMNREIIQSEHAFIWRQYRWAGCSINGRIASFRGDMVVPVENSDPPFWRYDSYSREMWFSSYHLFEHAAPAYIDALSKFDPELIYAYPSAIGLLAKYAFQLNLTVSCRSLKGIVTSSETLSQNDKTLLESLFKVPVFDWYGSFERVVFIGTCEHGRSHIFPDYGITELVPMKDGNEDTAYELVGTGFINWVMPLIRYRTGDTVTLYNDGCPCGRAFPIVGSINGRLDDMVVTSKGRMVGRLDHIFKGVMHIRLSQIIQENFDEIRILVVADRNYSEIDAKTIVANVAERLGKEIKVQIDLVSDIPRLPNGKFKSVVSRIRH